MHERFSIIGGHVPGLPPPKSTPMLSYTAHECPIHGFHKQISEVSKYCPCPFKNINRRLKSR